MPINKDEILKKSEEIEAEDALGKKERKTRKELWKSQSLQDSLYNEENGKKIPRASDIDQGSYSNLNYMLKGYALGDCHLLANLMGLAKTRPSFIKSDLIKIKNENEVEVGFFEIKNAPLKVKGDHISMTVEVEPTSKKFFSVTKDEALKWKTSHKALWPVVIEIAYAKYIKDRSAKKMSSSEQFNQIKAAVRPFVEQDIRNKARETGGTFSDAELQEAIEMLMSSESFKKQVEKQVSEDSLRQMISKGDRAAATLTCLTGVKSKEKSFSLAVDIKVLEHNIDEEMKKKYKAFKDVDTTNVKAFQGQYSPEALKIYEKIQKKLKTTSNKTIVVGFKGVNPGALFSTLKDPDKLPGASEQDIAFFVIAIAKKLKENAKGAVKHLISENSLTEKECEEWLKRNKLTLDELQSSTDTVRKKFALETVNLEKFFKFKVSKTKTGIDASHAYLVVGTLEQGGYKYIVLKNTFNMDTKIDYKKSSKIPKEIEFPEQLKTKNEAIMELNHFYKKVAQISYDVTPAKEKSRGSKKRPIIEFIEKPLSAKKPRS